MHIQHIESISGHTRNISGPPPPPPPPQNKVDIGYPTVQNLPHILSYI